MHEVRRQSELILDWVRSDDCRRLASSLVNRFGLACEPEDLVQQAWIRVTTSFAARTIPLPSLDDSTAAARYGYRIVSNIALDLARSHRRRGEIATTREEIVEGPENDAVSAVYFEELIRRITATPVSPGNCGGCSPTMVKAIAVRAVQALAIEARRGAPESGGDWFDRIVDEAIGRIAGDTSSARSRKRKSRCKTCVRDLVERAVAQMEGRHG